MTTRHNVWSFVLIAVVSPCAAQSEWPGDDEQDEIMNRGRAIFGQRCASCHGDDGQGNPDYFPDALVGDSTIPELSQLISETMPEPEPESCVGDDAAAVATFIHDTFYSEAARRRNSTPNIKLARLTGDQLRRSLADLYGHFHSSVSLVEERGLRGEYFAGARPRRSNRKIDRTDPTIEFDFGTDGPGQEINAEDYSIQWSGAILPDETGSHEIVIRSSCAFVCGFGDDDREFINNHVQSGNRVEFRRSVVLTAGRVYPIKIDFYQRKRKTEQPPANFSLAWTPPRGVEEVIPSRSLLPISAPAAFALQTRLPPDDRSYGYERGITVNRQWDESTTAAAIEFAQAAIDDLWPDYQRRHRNDADENRARLRQFLIEILEVAFRGPADDQVRKVYVDQQVDATEDDAEAIKRSILITLKSPRFLYPGLDVDRSASQRAANRLALVLFDSLPSDSWLVQLVANEQLQTEPQIRAAARRMVNDYRTQGKTRELLIQWLNLENFSEITKDASAYPGFDAVLVSDLRASLIAFLDDVVWSESSDFRQFFEADWAFTTARITDYYGDVWRPDGQTDANSEDRLARTAGHSELRAGVLTHPYLMSGLAYPGTTSPIHRGVFLIRYMLGRTLRPPNEAFTPLSPDLHPELSTRERVTLQTSPKSCQVCHAKINGLGFTLENYDAVGRYRLTERNRAIDATGSYTTRTKDLVKLTGPRELADYLAASDDAHRAFVNRTFQHFVKQPPAAFGSGTLDRLTDAFRTSGFNIRELIVEVAVVAARPR